jgi:hypothetical protein
MLALWKAARPAQVKEKIKILVNIIIKLFVSYFFTDANIFDDSH